jgi:hypothetical protein
MKEPYPGKIIKNYKPDFYGLSRKAIDADGNKTMVHERNIYQCIRNIATPAMALTPGKTYVGVGFVDNSQILFG